MEALTTPLTTLIEWVWCAAQVGASNVEMFLFLLLLATVMTISWHATRWQKKMLMALHGIQNQLQSLEESKVHQTEQMTEILKAVSQAETIKELLSIANEIGILKQQLMDAVNQLTSQTDTIKKIVMVTTEVEVLKKHLLEVLSQLSTMKSIAPEVAGLHKLVSTITSDCGKLGGMFNRLTETHGLVIHLPNAQKQESLMEKIQKNLEDYADKVQKNLDRKIEDLIEKTAVLRVVLDQKTEKQNTTYKEWHGHTNQQLGNAISLLRGLGPAIPEIKRVADMVTMGRDASSQAQHTLQQNTETAQAVEDRLVRIEPIISGLVDQTADLETKVEAIQGEMPALQEILSRLPKLPTRKPPADRSSSESTGSSNVHTGQAGGHRAHPSTPPTTLGPQQPAAQHPTVIPVSLDAGANPGIQLRLSEHLGSQPQVCISENRSSPNFLITPIPAQQTSQGAILEALFNNRR